MTRLEGYVRADGVPDEKHAVVRLAPPRAAGLLDAEGADGFQDMLDLVLQVVGFPLRGEGLVILVYEAGEILAVDVEGDGV